ncbi:MAG: hypothetical protein WCQ32_01860 [bacterium]
MNLFNFFKKKNKLETRSSKEIFRDGFKKQAKVFKTKTSSPAGFKKLGYPAWAVKDMGYSASEMANGGYTNRSLKMAGFTDEQINGIK